MLSLRMVVVLEDQITLLLVGHGKQASSRKKERLPLPLPTMVLRVLFDFSLLSGMILKMVPWQKNQRSTQVPWQKNQRSTQVPCPKNQRSTELMSLLYVPAIWRWTFLMIIRICLKSLPMVIPLMVVAKRSLQTAPLSGSHLTVDLICAMLVLAPPTASSRSSWNLLGFPSDVGF
ncbi:uncharacterized protein LOC112185952 isoform X11 [Rosa chinensis]|uniref:uncharacterized protein LOC112185952 isoform X11 n=1 Tax=Rosa chinensis TaxID=74649 RepID=UPI001AD94C12|nr:uncharacterized protein LOC112185952 isoform X11 [Rosa chinensis]